MVLLHPDDGSVESWTAEGSADKMRQDFDDFEPRFVALPQLTHTRLTHTTQNPQVIEPRRLYTQMASHGPPAPQQMGTRHRTCCTPR